MAFCVMFFRDGAGNAFSVTLYRVAPNAYKEGPSNTKALIRQTFEGRNGHLGRWCQKVLRAPTDRLDKEEYDLQRLFLPQRSGKHILPVAKR